MLPLAAAASPHHFHLVSQNQQTRLTHPNTRHPTPKTLPQAARTRAGVAATDHPLGQRPAAGAAAAAGAAPYGEEAASGGGCDSGAGLAQGRGARTGAGAAPVGTPSQGCSSGSGHYTPSVKAALHRAEILVVDTKLGRNPITDPG